VSMPALAARPPAGVATAMAGTAPIGPAGSAGAQGDGDNLFAALLAGLGEAATVGPANEDASALPGALPVDAAAAAGDPAAPAAAPDPLAGMALLMAQYTTMVPPGNTPAGTAAPAGAPSPAGAALPAASCAALAPATPAAFCAALPAGPGAAPAKTSSPALPGADVSSAPGPVGLNTTEPAALALLPAVAADTAPGPTPTDAQATLQALPDMASLTGGWAATPTPAAAPGPAAAAPVYQAELPSRPGDAAFAGDLAAQVTVLVEGGFQQAELRLNPAELGPIQIQLNVSTQTQTADISFSAVHGLTRESIEQALPELRDMLEAQGLSLGQTGVSGGQQQGGDGRDSAAAQARTARAGAAPGADGAPVQAGQGGLGTHAVAARATRGMLDLYA
jgi:flagellar hook-length control protein FliK